MLDLGSFFGMIDQIARSSGAVVIARNVHVDVPMAKTVQPPSASPPPPPAWTLDEAATVSDRTATMPAGPRLLGLRPPDGGFAGRSTIGGMPPSQLAGLALGALLAGETDSPQAVPPFADTAQAGSNPAASAPGRNAALISALAGAMAMIDREIADAEAARDGAAAPAGTSASDRSAAAFGAAAGSAMRGSDQRIGAGTRSTAETADRLATEPGATHGATAGEREGLRGAGSSAVADRLAAQVLGAVLAGGGAAGIIESAILNAAMIPGYPRPRPLVGVEAEQARAAAALAPDPSPEADPMDEARIAAFLAILGLPEAMMAKIRAMLADDERRKGFLLTLMRMLKMVKLVLGSVRDELEKIAEDVEEELARHGDRTPRGRHRLTL